MRCSANGTDKHRQTQTNFPSLVAGNTEAFPSQKHNIKLSLQEILVSDATPVYDVHYYIYYCYILNNLSRSAELIIVSILFTEKKTESVCEERCFKCLSRQNVKSVPENRLQGELCKS